MRGKHDFIAESVIRLKSSPIIKIKGKIELSPESVALVEVQAPRDIIGNKKYQLNPEGYLPQGIIPLDLVHSFDKTPRTLFVPILNTSSKYENIPKGSLLGTFEPIDEEGSEVQVTSWTDLEGKIQKAHQQLRKKKSYRRARQKCHDKEEEPMKLLPDYPADSCMEMIPTIESLLARLEGCKYFSILYLRSGYHHIGLSEQSKPLTAFMMHSGKFQWNVLPFGIGIGVQTFSFVINKAIGHCSDFAANYIDDIIVFSETAEDHMEHLERIFTVLQMADLKIKVLKCEFFKKHISYLGFLIGETGICCDRTKVEAINKIATPTSIEEVCQFNGMCSYYRKFISHYSDISKCFNDMTKKGATFNWRKECDAAFKLLKEKLMEDLVLISPQVDKDYVIHCDASKYSYSGILQQTRPGMEELAPVAYFSGNFDKTQVKWNITEKEAYAIYKSVKKFTFYITGAKTTVFSDHKPLKNFFEGGMNITKLDRWSLELQQFDISLEFI